MSAEVLRVAIHPRRLVSHAGSTSTKSIAGTASGGQLSQSPKGQQVHPLELSNPKGLNNRNWAG